MVQPQVVGVDAPLVAVVPQTENAGAVTPVGEIDIQRPFIFVANGHHTKDLLLPFDPKEPAAVFIGALHHFLGGKSLDLGDGLGHPVDIP